jgi:hypothetical protein
MRRNANIGSPRRAAGRYLGAVLERSQHKLVAFADRRCVGRRRKVEPDRTQHGRTGAPAQHCCNVRCPSPLAVVTIAVRRNSVSSRRRKLSLVRCSTYAAIRARSVGFMLNSTVISCVAHRTTRIVPAHRHTHGRTRTCAADTCVHAGSPKERSPHRSTGAHAT